MKKSRNISKKYLKETLHFPVFKDSLPGPPVLGMDEYYKFVMDNLEWFKDIHKNAPPENPYPVNARFQLKEDKDLKFQKNRADELPASYKANPKKRKNK